MKKAILATKVGMTQIFNEDGTLVPVTVLQAGPCVVTQVKTVENDGYEAIQVGFVDKKEKIVNKDAAGKKEVIHRHGVNKALKGHFTKAGVTSKRFVREFRFENAGEYALAQEIKADIFAAGDKIDASAISKGKGFQGAIKRHGQSRGPMGICPARVKKLQISTNICGEKLKNCGYQFKWSFEEALADWFEDNDRKGLK